jgi:beta-lactamase regulating signal transducer with metallopeptidase domain
MAMLELLRPGVSLPWDLVWQSCLVLAAGLLLSFMLRRSPARAHRILALAVVAAMATPCLSQAIRWSGWGILTPVQVIADGTEASVPGDRDAVIPGQGQASRPVPETRESPLPPAQARGPFLVPAFAGNAPAATSKARGTGIDWRATALRLWLALSTVAATRLVLSFLQGFALVRKSRPLDDARLREAAAGAVARMGLVLAPEVRSSSRLHSPSVWCWGRKPILLVPERASMNQHGIDWVAVFCHELAHWRRCDHLFALGSQVLTCLLPWNPLAWWASVRMSQLAELACDDWVLASGLVGTEYAASLVELAPQRGPLPALAAVSSRRGLIGRVRHILEDHRSSPAVGKRWAGLAMGLTLLSASALALTQAGSARSPSHGSRIEGSPSEEPANAKHTVHVTVNTADGKPIANASVLLVGLAKPPLSFSALPRDHKERTGPRTKEIAQIRTDEHGRGDLSGEFSLDDNSMAQLFVSAPGFGYGSHPVQASGAEIDARITLAPQVLIQGRLLTPAGAPAAGVRVVLNGFHSDSNRNQEGIYPGLTASDDALPAYWPRPLKTDGNGRFTIQGVPGEAYATLSFWHPDFAVDEVTVSTVASGTISPGLKAFEIVPVKPTFTHTLEPARPVQGRITEKATGKPIAGLSVEMIPMRRHGGMPFGGRTDADGRFRISGHQTDFMYITSVYPPADSGYLAASETRQGWPAGAKFMEVNFALERGRLVHGRVVDQDTRQPIAGAAIMYQPARNNPNSKDAHDLRTTVLTDEAGKFTITGLAGEGMLIAEVPSLDAVRTPVSSSLYGRTAYPHGSVEVNVPADSDPKPAEIAIRQGVTLQAKVVDPAGQPVKDVIAFYPGIQACLIDVWNQGQEFADGIVRIRGADPGRTYRVYVMQHESKLGAVADLKFNRDATSPLEVKLAPMATIRGKVAAPGGAPAPDCQVYASLVLASDRNDLSKQDLFNHDLVEIYGNILGQRHMDFLGNRSGQQGEFTMGGLIPGANFYVTAAQGSGRSAQVPVPDLKPGEVRDLGTLVLEERKP